MLTTYHTLTRGPSLDLFAAYCKKIVLFCIFITFYPVAFGQTQYPVSNLTANESYPGNVQTLSFSLPTLTPSGATIVAWDVNVSSGNPSHGAITGGIGTQNLVYTPVNYSEESNQFNWKAEWMVERLKIFIL